MKRYYSSTAEFAGKKVAILGLGREGLSTLMYLRRQLPELRITAINESPIASDTHAIISQDSYVNIIIEKVGLKQLCEFDIIVKSPGISIYRREIQDAKEKGVIFTSATQIWFADHPNEKTVCITGTKGKSTTSTLIAHLLKFVGCEVALAGNIGKPLLDTSELKPRPDFFVIELSSYQTSDFVGLPYVSVLLNLFPEHLDWHGDEETYYRDKIRLLEETETGIIILNRMDELSKKYSTKYSNAVFFNDNKMIHFDDNYIWDGKNKLINVRDINLKGKHNLSNICAALTAVRCLGIDIVMCIGALKTFQGLPHRMSILGELNGVIYVDDSISTTPKSAEAAIETFSEFPITILLGGFDRGLMYEDLALFLMTKSIQAVITMPDNGHRIADTIRAVMAKKGAVPFPVYQAESLSDAVRIAKQVTLRGSVVLLSPAAPSYGRFRDYEDRSFAFAREAGFECEE
jgi:UDP-N-acetylmuramoylalanine--D-glutamate ligase